MRMSEEQKYLEVLKNHEDWLKKDVEQNADEMQMLNQLMDSKRKYSERRKAEVNNAMFERATYENKIKGG